MGIPEPIVQWAKNDIEQLKINLSEMDANDKQLKLRRVIEDRENMIYRTIDYFIDSLWTFLFADVLCMLTLWKCILVVNFGKIGTLLWWMFLFGSALFI